MRLKLHVIIVSCLFSIIAAGQGTFVYTDPQAAMQQGLSLFNEHNYLSARKRFEEIYKTDRRPQDNASLVLMQNLEFYIAACAAEMNEKDAEMLLLGYFRKYHETDKRRLICFYLGKYYFQNRKYAESSDWFAKVRAGDLTAPQLVEYKFDLAYSYFIKKKFDEAKPLFREIKDNKGKYFYPSNYYYAFICFYQKNYTEARRSFKAIEDSKMYAAVIPYYLAQIYFLDKEYDTTIAYIQKTIGRSDLQYTDEMNHLMGQAYFMLSDYSAALPLLEAFVAKNNKVRKEDIYELGYCYYAAHNYPRAIDNFVQMNLFNDSLGQSSTYALADCYLHSAQKDKARSAFQSASMMDFDSEIKRTSMFNFGKLSFELNYYTDAIMAFETYLKDNPSGRYTEEANELLASALIKTHNYERSYKIMESLPDMSPTIKEAYQRVTYYRAVEIYNDKNYNAAVELCDKSLKFPVLQELAALATYLRGEAFYQQQDFDKALENYELFNRAMKPFMEGKIDVSEFRSEYNMAYCYFRKKDFRSALFHFRRSLAEAAETKDEKGKKALTPDLYMRLAECYFINKDYPNALDCYARVAANSWPDAEYAQYQKGVVLGLLGRNEEKITALNELIRSYPKSLYVDQATYEKGETYMDMDNHTAAIAAYNEVLNRYGASSFAPRAALKIALALYNMNKKEDALDRYKAVVKKYPESPESRRAVAAIKDLSVELGRPDEFVSYASSESEKDSLTYMAAETAYGNGDCVKAVPLFREYCTKFPGGIFANEAHYYRAECLLKSRDYQDAYGDYLAIINNKYARFYEHALLNASGIAYYELKDTSKAYDLYIRLMDASTTSANTYTATTGALKTAFKLGRFEEAMTFADKVMALPSAREADLYEALYIKAKSALALHQDDIAYINFNRLSLATVSERAAESKFMVASMLFNKQEFQASLDTCFSLKGRFESYDYWVVKAFILIAKDYAALDNAFQAKATLESIIENYKGDRSLVEEARATLDKLDADALNKSRIQIKAPQDSTTIEQDTIK